MKAMRKGDRPASGGRTFQAEGRAKPSSEAEVSLVATGQAALGAGGMRRGTDERKGARPCGPPVGLLGQAEWLHQQKYRAFWSLEV